MKNLRKFLCVVLVLCMALSLASIASASYTDDSSIKYKTAVGVLSGIGAIDGKPGGAFDPTGLVTRAEAAKLVSYAILGKLVAASLSTTTSSFKDVPATHWASPFIEYCASKGIINGLGDGTYNPNGNVTGFELAKLMLCAVGYGQNKEYVGANWSINVASDALNKDIFKGNETANFAAPATREEAALYIFNGLMVPQVQYNSLFGYYGKGTSVTAPGTGSTIAADVYKMTSMKGMVVGGSVTGDIDAGTLVSPASFNTEKTKVVGFDDTVKILFEAKAADIGQLLSIYYNTATMKAYYTETISTSISTIFGALTANMYLTTFGSATFTAATGVWKITDSYAVAEGRNDTSAANATFLGLVVGASAPAGTYAIFGGQIISLTSLPKTSFEKVTAIVTTAGAQSITFSSTGKLSNTTLSDLVKEYDGIKVGDYVTLAKTGFIYTVGQTTTVDGKISKVDQAYGASFGVTSVTLDGKVINASQATGSAGLTEALPSATTDYANNTYTLYLDAAGNMLASVLKSGASLSSVVYVTGAAWEAMGDYGTVYKVQAVNNAGETVIYTTATANNSDATPAAIAAGFYKVTVDATSKLATFKTTIALTDLAVAAEAQTLAASSIKNGTSYFFASDVKFIFVDGYQSDLTVTKVTGLAAVAGVILDAGADGDMLFFNKTTSPNKTVSTVIVTAAFEGASTAKTMFVKSDASSLGASSDGTVYSVYLDGVKTNITCLDADLKNVDGADTDVRGHFVNYVINDKGFYDILGIAAAGTKLFTDEEISLNGIFNGMVSTSSGDSAKVAANAVVLDFVTSAFDPAIYTSIAAMEASTDTKIYTVSYAKNSDGEISVMYVVGAVTPEITITAQPAAATAVGLGDATVSVTATTTYGTLTYQWQMNIPAFGGWSNVGGNATATTDSLTVSDLGHNYWNDGDTYEYRCIITIDGTTITTTSDIVVITYNASAT